MAPRRPPARPARCARPRPHLCGLRPGPQRGRQRCAGAAVAPAVAVAVAALAGAGSSSDAARASASAAQLPRPPRASPAFGGGGGRVTSEPPPTERGRGCRELPLLQDPGRRVPAPRWAERKRSLAAPASGLAHRKRKTCPKSMAVARGVRCTRVSVRSQERGRACLADFSLLNDVSSVILSGVHLAPVGP